MGRSILEVSCACSTSEWCGPTDAALSSPDKGLTEQEYKDIVLEDVTVAGRQRAVCSMMLVLTATILDDIQT